MLIFHVAPSRHSLRKSVVLQRSKSKNLPCAYRCTIIDGRAEFFEDAHLAAVINAPTMTARMLCEACSIRSRRTDWNEPPQTQLRARARNCTGASFGVTTAGAAGFVASWPCVPRAAPADWPPSPSPRRRPLRQARHQDRCVGHGKAPFSRTAAGGP